jgi:uncharacterized protein (DUF2062 family)
LRARARAEWTRLLASPEKASRLARGIGAGAFAAMLPAFGLHVLIALAVAWLARGSRAAAAASCLLIGNPLTHAALLPVAYELGHRLLPAAAVPRFTDLPAWLAALLPVGEEALAGGAVLGVVAAGVAYALTRRALRRRSRQSLR